MSKFKLTQTATEVQNILNNSLQKPTGLTKTKLVGVGVNGQENIEIGDNLTLANGKLSSAAGGGGVNGLQSDAEGNLTASKNLGVDGKLTLKSLVSASNPDGDITKELGGGSILYEYTAKLINSGNIGVSRMLKFYSSADIGTNSKTRNTKQIFDQIIPTDPEYVSNLIVFGYAKISEGVDTSYYSLINLELGFDHASLYYLNPAKGQVRYNRNFIDDNWDVRRFIASPRKAK